MSSAAACGSSPGVEALARLVAHVRQVAVHVAHAGRVGDRPVAGHQHVGAELEDALAGHQPIAEARPHDRRAVDEQQVAGEHRATARYVDDRVAAGMRRPELDQRDVAVADLQVEPTLERLRRQAHRDALVVERPERVLDEVAHIVGHPGRGLQRVEHLRRQRLHLLGGSARRVDLGRGRQQLVAEAMVGVGVRVHRGVDRMALDDRCHRREHLARQMQVVERVDEQRRAVGGDQPGVAPAPAAVGL